MWVLYLRQDFSSKLFCSFKINALFVNLNHLLKRLN
jgi:hypothetical protein